MTKPCPTCGRIQKRSSEANRRYWALLHEIALKPVQGINYTAETWHLYCKQRFLGMTEIKMPNGKAILVPQSTADLSTSEFNDYMTAVEAWAAEHGIYLPDGE